MASTLSAGCASSASLLSLLELRELRESLLAAMDVQMRVRLRAVSRTLRLWAEESFQVQLQLHKWTTPVQSEPRPGVAWSDRLGGLLYQGGVLAHWAVWAAFEQAHAPGDQSLAHSGIQMLRLLDLSVQNWPAAARSLSARDVSELLSETRRSLRVLRLDGASATLPFSGRCALFSKGSAYHAKVTTLPQLRELSVTHAFGLGDDEATALALGCPQLHRLRISHDKISPSGWHELLTGLGRLDELEVAFSSINDRALLQPDSLLAPALTCRCGAGGCRCPTKRPPLRTFKITSCPGVTDLSLQQLLDRLRPTSAARTLTSFHKQMLPPPGWLTELRKGQGPVDNGHLSRQASLVALNICSCGLTCGLELVVEAAQGGHLPALVELGLCDGQLRLSDATDSKAGTTAKEAGWLHTILRRCSALTCIDVRGCAGGGCALALEPKDLMRPLRSLSAGFLLPALVCEGGSGVTGGLKVLSRLVELRLGLGARVNDALLSTVSGSGSASSLEIVDFKFGVFEDSGLVRIICVCLGDTCNRYRLGW
eukprot:COSAG02_NODE_677_length_18591_cov_105.949221_12_plen_540_part_00